MNDHRHDNAAPDSGRVEVPLSVWPVAGQADLIGRLTTVFTAPEETVATLGIEGAAAITEHRRNGSVVCDKETAASEHTALARAGGSSQCCVIMAYDQHGPAPLLELLPRHVLTIARDRVDWDASLWQLIARAVPDWGLLAVLWDGPTVSLPVRTACLGAGLAYAGHIAAAEYDAFDRAAATAAGLDSALAGKRPRRAHTNVALWARFPDRAVKRGL